MALNVTTAVIGGGCQRAVSSPSLAQWDRGQILKITGVDLPVTYNVEFCCQGDLTTTTMLGGADGVEIPNLLLQRGLPIIAYLVLHEGQDDRETEYWITIYVKQRAMPPSVTPDPEQADIIDQLVAALNEGVTAAENAAAQAEAQVEHYPTVIDGTWHVWNALTESWVDTEVPATGPAGRGITSVTQNADYTLTLTFTDGTDWTTPTPVRGATGATPNLTIGTVTTGAAGSSAAASITGTAENPVLSLTIPQGLKGDPGNGDAIAPTFSASTAYPAGAYVIYNGSLYRFTAAHAAGAWTGTDAVAAVLGTDVAELKGDFDDAVTILNQQITDLKGDLDYKADKVYGGTTTNVSVDMTPCKAWHSTLGTMVNGSNRAAGGPVKVTPDMKSISVASGYTLLLYGNNEGLGHALTTISSWTTTPINIVGNITYKYIFPMLAKSPTQSDFSPTDDLSSVVNIATYDTALKFALDDDLTEAETMLENTKKDLFTTEKTIGYIHLNLHKENIINNAVYSANGQATGAYSSTRACNNELIPLVPNVPIYFTIQSGYSIPQIFYFKNGSYQGYDSSFASGNSYDADAARFLFFKNPSTADITPQNVEDNYLLWQEASNSYNNRIDALEDDVFGDKYITCWGDSLTSMGGWTTQLATLTGLTVKNAGVGGEAIEQIRARQGADAYIIEGVTIPADTSAVTLTTNATGFKTQLGKTGIKPNFTGSSVAHFNPCKIGGITGTLARNGTGSSDTITFARSESGNAVTLSRPETIDTNADMNWNDPYLMIAFMGQNSFGFDNDEEITTTISEANITNCIESAKLMIAHAKAKNALVLGIATGTAASNADYEAAMQKEFGRYFLSVRQYLVHPVYDGNNEITTCYGLQDLSLTPTAQDLTDIAEGKVPSRCFMDGIHFVEALRPFIGDAIYKRCKELNIF